MTIHFYDRSKYDGTGWVPVGPTIIRAGEGSFEQDPLYIQNRSKMVASGYPWLSYWFLTQDPVSAQLDLCEGAVGRGTPIMLDVERDGTRTPTMDTVLAFVDGWHTRGGRVVDMYLPHWYWQNLGSPSLHWLVDPFDEGWGIALHSSNYTTYSDDGPGWLPYGGITPTYWQYQGGPDVSAYKGTTPIEQLWKDGIPMTTPDATLLNTVQDIFAVQAAMAAGADTANRHGSTLNLDLRPYWTRVGVEAAKALVGGGEGPEGTLTVTSTVTSTIAATPPAAVTP